MPVETFQRVDSLEKLARKALPDKPWGEFPWVNPGTAEKKMFQALAPLVWGEEPPALRWAQDYKGNPIAPEQSQSPREIAKGTLRDATNPGSANHAEIRIALRYGAAVRYGGPDEVKNAAAAVVQCWRGQETTGHCCFGQRDETGAPGYWNYHVAAMAAGLLLARLDERSDLAGEVAQACLSALARERWLCRRCRFEGRVLVPGKRGAPPERSQGQGVVIGSYFESHGFREGCLRMLETGKPEEKKHRQWHVLQRGQVVMNLGSWFLHRAASLALVALPPDPPEVFLRSGPLHVDRQDGFRAWFERATPTPGDWMHWAVRCRPGGSPEMLSQSGAGEEPPQELRAFLAFETP
jgi:hypothetical protein